MIAQRKYRIITKRNPGNGKDKIESQVAIYLGDNSMGEHEVSLRPLAGTNHIRTDTVISAIETKDPIELPKVVRRFVSKA